MGEKEDEEEDKAKRRRGRSRERKCEWKGKKINKRRGTNEESSGVEKKRRMAITDSGRRESGSESGKQS